jgi:Uma2 family endonuclease
MSAAPELKATVEDLERLSAQGYRYELIDGELREMSPVGSAQAIATINLSSYATVHVRQHRLGTCFAAEAGFRFPHQPETVLAPDWAFIAVERAPAAFPKRGFLEAVPDLVLETRAPDDSRREIQEKIDRWLAAGVRVVWDLDPERRVLAVHRPGTAPQTLGQDDVLTEEELLPRFSIKIAELF